MSSSVSASGFSPHVRKGHPWEAVRGPASAEWRRRLNFRRSGEDRSPAGLGQHGALGPWLAAPPLPALWTVDHDGVACGQVEGRAARLEGDHEPIKRSGFRDCTKASFRYYTLTVPMGRMGDRRVVLEMADRQTPMDRGRMRTGRGGTRAGDEVHLSSLNFKVPAEFKREFKGYAVSRGMSMIDLLKEGFALSKERNEQ